jgi:hypothetical protein
VREPDWEEEREWAEGEEKGVEQEEGMGEDLGGETEEGMVEAREVELE